VLIDFHSHTRISDGHYHLEEWARLAARRGYVVLGVSDHVGERRVEERVEALVRRVADLPEGAGLPRVIPGCEITRVPPERIADVAARARAAGARYVIVHGETPMDAAEPMPGVNRAAIEARVDILGHPGFITREEMRRAAELGVTVEISGRPVHSLANGHVLALARECGARCIIDSDAHDEGDLFTPERHEVVGRGAGMSAEEYAAACAHARALAIRVGGFVGDAIA
jgi:histidinol phosphatase-like PHP family hydrolase